MGTLRELHPNPRFTKYLVEKRAFEQDPLVVIDAGARKGFEKHWNHYEDQIKLIGFEPNEDSYKECIEKKSSSKTEYYPFALGRERGEKDFYITTYLSGCSLMKPDLQVAQRFGFEKNVTVKDKISVQTIDLDSFVNDYEIEYVDFIKLDTEGSELDIFKGAQKTVNNSVIGISTEVKFVKVQKDQPLFTDIDIYLRNLGFHLYDLDLNRSPRKVLANNHNISNIGQIILAQALYLRDTVDELIAPNNRKNFWSKDRNLKMASILEIYNLSDCAMELIQTMSELGMLKENEVERYLSMLDPTTNQQKKLNYLSNSILGIFKK